jgi:hypothetical protein
VQLRDRKTGKTIVYSSTAEALTPAQIAKLPRRVMDCVDCHNRPTHIYEPPDRAVDAQLLAGSIDRSLPFIKQKSVELLTKEYASTEQAVAAIGRDLDAYYRADHAAIYAAKSDSVKRASHTLQELFKSTVFPDMKVDWRTHPDNRGHFYFPGCFRCHDNQHKSADGKVITKSCDLCHSVVGQKEDATVMADTPDAGFTHPVDLGDMTEVNCSDCHTGAPM